MKLLLSILVIWLLAISNAALHEPRYEYDDFDSEDILHDASYSHDNELEDGDETMGKAPLKELESRYPPTKDGKGFDVPLMKVWKSGCEGTKMPNETEYQKALEHMAWFCKQKIFTKKTSMFVSIVGETVVYVCSKFGAGNPCRYFEYAMGERAINDVCGLGMAGWVKLEGWPRIYGRATINQTICRRSHWNIWGQVEFQISPGQFWVNGSMYEEWRDGHGFYNTTWVEPYRPWDELFYEHAYGG